MKAFIPVANPRAEINTQKEEITRAVMKVLSCGQYILGEEVHQFEREFADFLGVPFCIGVASGTDALVLALKSVGVVPGDEVITVSHSAVATAAAIHLAGAVPVFVDIDPVSRCVDPSLIYPVITERTKAILPVHIYGQPADMKAIVSVAQKFKLRIVEDCAQAHGADVNGRMVGTFGDAAAFSFYPTKNLGCVGDGGAVVSKSAEIAERIKELREYGWRKRFVSSSHGMNSRLDEIQAAILRIKLPKLMERNARRREIGQLYCEAIAGSDIVPPGRIEGTGHAMHLFVVECEKREELISFLERAGVKTALHYPMAIHRQPAFVGARRSEYPLPVTDRLYGRMVTLPMWPELSVSQVNQICSLLKRWKK